ncbi:hypothetical protein EU545_00970 [Candidatus Thorarchaeota archaeon]|nr:MAG: hypothetical protein EU545_00970 [Candidatus Thorarchaeota archaeon]
MTFGSKDESYWLGVRDALRMIDSFLKWKDRNPEKAKPLDQFMHEALIAAAKRCESCLSHALGIDFSAEGEEGPDHEGVSRVDFFERTDSMVEDSPLARTLTDPDDLYFERTAPLGDSATEAPSGDESVPSDEVTLPDSPILQEESEPEGREETAEPDFDDVESASIDYIERTPEETTREPDFEGGKDFSEEFELSEPESLVVEGEEDAETALETPSEEPAIEDESDFELDIESAASEVDSPAIEWKDEEADEEPDAEDARLSGALDQLEREFSSHGMDISPRSSEAEPVTDEEVPDAEAADEEASPDAEEDDSFTWRDYESSVGPAAEEHEPADDRVEHEEAPRRTDFDEEELRPPEEPDETEVEYEEPEVEEHSLWTPYDEPSSVEPEEADAETDEEDVEEDEEEESRPKTTKAPPPPPPPESDESEEERRRRARRLFFGA